MEVLRQFLEYRQMLFELQPGERKHDQRCGGVLGVRAVQLERFGMQDPRLHAKKARLLSSVL